jgi:hypothetical protein
MPSVRTSIVCPEAVLHAGEEGVFAVVVHTEQQEPPQTSRSGCRDRGVLEQRLELGREREPTGAVDVIQRLDAEPVAREEELGLLAIGDREREHADEAVDHRRAPLLEAAQDHLRVGVVGDEAAARARGCVGAPRGCRSRR